MHEQPSRGRGMSNVCMTWVPASGNQSAMLDVLQQRSNVHNGVPWLGACHCFQQRRFSKTKYACQYKDGQGRLVFQHTAYPAQWIVAKRNVPIPLNLLISRSHYDPKRFHIAGHVDTVSVEGTYNGSTKVMEVTRGQISNNVCCV